MKTMERGVIFDPLRKKEVAATPEELVRQNVIQWLNIDKKIPLVMMNSEYHFRFNGLDYRADIVVFAKDLSPLMLVECKAPDVKLTDTVINQGVRYNRVLKLKYMMFTNGKQTYFCQRKGDGCEYEFVSEIPEIKL